MSHDDSLVTDEIFHGTDGVDFESALTLVRDVLAEERSVLERRASALTDEPSIPLTRRRSRPESVASSGQKRLWFLHGLSPSSAAYHLPLRFAVTGRLDEAVLSRALDALVARHESLRSTFRWNGDELKQTVRDAAPLALETNDLRGLSDEDRGTRAAALETEHATRPFDLERGPLLRARRVLLTGSDELLLLAVHHIACDAWSGAQLCRELRGLYEAFAGGDVPPAGPTLQYADFAEWERARWDAGHLAPQLEYWKRRLAGVAPLTLPGARPRPPSPSGLGAKVRLTIARETTEKLTALARGRQATLFMGLLTAFKLLLARHTGRTDVAVGSGIAARGEAELQRIVGLFLNTVVLRSDLSGNPDFTEALGRVRETTLGACAHPDVPFERLVEALQPERHPGRNPLFDIAFTLNEHAEYDFHVPGARLTLDDPNLIDTGSAKFDLSVHLWGREGAIEGVFEYNRDLFSHDVIARLARHFHRLLEDLAEAPGRRLEDIPLVDELDRARLDGWNDTAFDGNDAPFLARFAEAVRSRPDAPAVVDDRETVSYRELDLRSGRLAARLRKLGVRPETPVGVCTDRSAALVVAFLGTLKAGGVYLPLDPRQPAERLRHMVSEAQCPLVLTDAIQRRLAEALGSTTVDVGDRSSLPEAPFEPRPVVGYQLAYLIYTSGSTGKPKGVAVEHRALAHLIDYTYRRYGIRSDDRAGFLTGLGFDPTVWELGTFLACGVAIHMGSEETRLSPTAMQAWILEQRLTILQLPAPMLDPLLELPWPASTELRTVLTGGDRLRRAPATALPFRIYNHYGPTEYSVIATSGEVRAEAPDYHPSCVGRPIANTRIHLLDADRRPVPPGAVGEIYLGGAGLARGYYRNAKLTAERFIADPFSSTFNARLYRTGDLGRWLDDGTLYFEGRADRQTKVRGMRIELGEIEAVLKGNHGIRDALVLPRPDPAGETALVAWYLRRPGVPADPRRFLRERLPEAMVPSRFIELDDFPLTANGKIDTERLPMPEWLPVLAAAPAPLEGSCQRRIAAVWSEVLGVASVGPHANFFDLGGHSMQLATVQSKLQSALGREIRMLDLLRHTTIAGLAGFLEPAGATLVAPHTESLRRGGERRERLARARSPR